MCCKDELHIISLIFWETESEKVIYPNACSYPSADTEAGAWIPGLVLQPLLHAVYGCYTYRQLLFTRISELYYASVPSTAPLK